jgi:hypothetical protein
MTVNAWNSFGSYSMSVDVEFNSESVSDCNQAEKYILACIGVKNMKAETEATENAET